MIGTGGSAFPRRFPFWWSYAVLWAVAGAGYFAIFVGQGSSWSSAASSVVVNVATAALLGALAVAVSDRLPPGLGWRGAVGLHAAFAGVFSGAWLVAVSLGLSMIASARAGTWVAVPLSGYAVPWQVFAGVMVYAAIVGAATAARSAAALSDERERVAAAETARARAELGALRARLQPHFLFNSLHGIATLVRHEPEAGALALEGLGELLHAALRVSGDGDDELALATEWALTERYLELERLRLGDRLRLQSSLEDDALNCLVPAFLLQPLLENSIRHAVAPRAAGAMIRVLASVCGGELVIGVEDDGPGADPRRVYSSGGLGLGIVRQRLAALHPRHSTLTVHTSPGAGFRVEARLPARHALGAS